MRSENLLMAL
ncbi:hypothetical protein CGLO_14742 [Colletotrichum gloeosporioides Cg-14]|uniref:Uncharacterized protein n=1 Tax=Colletotrichum gloeosporioides (strain Cg-14) TaxID=1237896 RepID=T0K0B9_COLGC|nr:hypothetical protein CGLO_14742 [Colletotrichum gloeosporioides Cg-14]